MIIIFFNSQFPYTSLPLPTCPQPFLNNSYTITWVLYCNSPFEMAAKMDQEENQSCFIPFLAGASRNRKFRSEKMTLISEKEATITYNMSKDMD